MGEFGNPFGDYAAIVEWHIGQVTCRALTADIICNGIE
jgi:hypothetical protein